MMSASVATIAIKAESSCVADMHQKINFIDLTWEKASLLSIQVPVACRSPLNLERLNLVSSAVKPSLQKVKLPL